MRMNRAAFASMLAAITVAFAHSAEARLAPQPTVAITVDDLPLAGADEADRAPEPNSDMAAVNRALLRAFKRHRAPATGFVIQSRVEASGDAGLAVLRSWIGQGFDLGNHTFSHADFNARDVSAEEAEVVRGERAFLPMMRAAGPKELFFRFPMNRT